MIILCECENFDCKKNVDMIVNEYKELMAEHSDVFVIVDGCEIGPKEFDIFLGKKSGYSLYRDMG